MDMRPCHVMLADGVSFDAAARAEVTAAPRAARKLGRPGAGVLSNSAALPSIAGSSHSPASDAGPSTSSALQPSPAEVNGSEQRILTFFGRAEDCQAAKEAIEQEMQVGAK